MLFVFALIGLCIFLSHPETPASPNSELGALRASMNDGNQSEIAIVTERRSVARTVLAVLTVGVLSLGQFIFIVLGCQSACDAFRFAYPDHMGWLDTPTAGGFGVAFAFLCIIYPIYFGIFRLGSQASGSRGKS